MSTLGESGLKLSLPIIVGCMSYGSKKSWQDWVLEDEEEVFKILKKCYDSGLRTFDTADTYSNGKSEELLGKFIKKYNIPRERIVILTKVNFPTDPNNPDFSIFKMDEYNKFDFINSQGLSRKHIFDAIEGSIKRLGTFVDVLQIHRLDPSTPKVEIMRALNDVVEKGYTRYIGASSMKTYEFAELQFIAHQRNWNKFISMQNFYNLVYREEEREMIPYCQNSDFQKVGIIPWSPLAAGILAKPVGQQSARSKSDGFIQMLGLDPLRDEDKEIVNRVEKIAKKNDVSMAVVATAWVISKGCYPIVGLSSVERVDDILKAVEFKLSEEDKKYLEESYSVKQSLF